MSLVRQKRVIECEPDRIASPQCGLFVAGRQQLAKTALADSTIKE